MKRRFATLDVFTDKAFAGNPLAVVLEPDGLDTPAMLAIAGNRSLRNRVGLPARESVVAGECGNLHPARELPFAGTWMVRLSCSVHWMVVGLECSVLEEGDAEASRGNCWAKLG